MRKITTMLAAAFLSTFSLAGYAQTKTGTIKGAVTDGSQKNVESATISLLRAKDSSVIKLGVADKGGNFSFENISSGKYLISISAVGHQKGYSKQFEISDDKTAVDLKSIELLPQTKSLNAVVVTAKRPLVEQKIDRTIVNVEASVTNVGSSALEVLEKSPGITVDKDGNISLKGKAGVMVLVDGRPTQLSGADLANLLRSMQSSQMDQIEIMTNPPARYDAAGNAGIINIKTKKNKQFGYNGSVNVGYGQGRYPKFNDGLNFNYRAGKWNLFTNLSHNYRKGFGNLDIQRNFYNVNTKDLSVSFDQQARMINSGNSFNGKVGADYFANKNTTYGIVVSGFTSPSKNRNNNLTSLYDANRKLISETRAATIAEERWDNMNANFNYRKVLDTAGKELTADLDYSTYTSQNSQNLSNYYFDAFGKTIQKGDTLMGMLPQDIKIYSGRIDYLQPMKKGARFEAGIKTSIVRTDNNAIYDTMHNDIVMHDFNRSNYFIYEENINAAYVNFSTPLSKKINAQFGLRAENTNAKGDQKTTGDKFDRHYTQLFPTAYFQYAANKNNNIGLNYGRRIRRPNYESLNPFIEYIDRYTYEQGNPNLKPQFSHNIELSHTYKNWLTTTLNYTKTNDIIQEVLEQNTEKQETYVRRANIANQRQLGFAISANNPITKWWTNSFYVNVSNNKFDGLVNNIPVSISATMMNLNSSQQFKFSKTFSGEISGFYRTPGIEGVIKTKGVGMIAAGLSKQIMKNNGTLRLTVRDIFNTQRFSAVSKYGNVDAAFQQRRDNQVVNVGFTYRFAKGKMNGGPKRRASSASEEQNRVGQGQ
ncbi:MAG TPA: TonB-dependent receptor [Chitinophagaceae bacterium]|nr:TonB-dependent receptor [Chitinophagaceae bacterium]